jgi:hypothetical protein
MSSENNESLQINIATSNDDIRSDGAFNFLPVIGNRSNAGRFGMTIGSIFAATMCAVAFFGNDDSLNPDNGGISVDQMFNEL